MRIIASFLLILLCASHFSAQFENEFQSVIETYDIEQNTQSITASVKLFESDSWQGASGFSHGSVPMDTSLFVGIASNTKLFTSILSLKMIENGFYSLEDPISKWLEPITFVDPNITVKQLLQHNGGLNDFINNSELFPGQILNEGSKVWTPEETLTYILEPIVNPGENVFYSNANYLLAAMVMEKATGLLYEDLLRDSIFTPLELGDIYLEGFEEIPGEMAHPFLLGFDYSSTDRTALGTSTWAAGCLVSKPRVLTQWYDIVFNSGYFSDFILSEITDFIEWPDDMEGKEMGLGLYRINIDDHIYYGHGGGTIGYASYTLYDTECGHTISVAINELFSDAFSLALLLAEKACELTNMETSTQEVQVNVAIFPNPASEKVLIPHAEVITLLSLEGIPLRTTRGSEMLLSDIPSGVYFVTGVAEGKTFTSKVIIQK